MCAIPSLYLIAEGIGSWSILVETGVQKANHMEVIQRSDVRWIEVVGFFSPSAVVNAVKSELHAPVSALIIVKHTNGPVCYNL